VSLVVASPPRAHLGCRVSVENVTAHRWVRLAFRAGRGGWGWQPVRPRQRLPSTDAPNTNKKKKKKKRKRKKKKLVRWSPVEQVGARETVAHADVASSHAYGITIGHFFGHRAHE